MKVLVFTPTYGDLLRQETVDSVKAQQFSGKFKHVIGRHNPFPGRDFRNVLAQYERARETALKSYDALLTVEHDMTLPDAALQQLSDLNVPVAYGVYVFRHGVAVLNAWELLPGSKNLGESLSLNRRKLDAARKQVIVPVSGVGFGCTLISREVLEQIPFRSGESGAEAPDVPFATDCLRSGVQQVADFGVPCGHYDGERWLWPFENAISCHVVANTCVTVRIEDETRRLIAGQTYDLPADDARELERAGYVSRVGD